MTGASGLSRDAALLALAIATCVPGAAATGHRCKENEAVAFNCPVKGRIASLCAVQHDGQLERLIYRFGQDSREELTYTAELQGQQRFFATSSPADPGASVRQVWFERSGFRYLLTQCVGGLCPYDAGLSVIRHQRLIMSERCERAASGTTLSSAFALPVEFGGDADSTRSSTPLIQSMNVDNLVADIYTVNVPAR